MKRVLIIFLIFISCFAQEVVLSQKEIDSWGIKERLMTKSSQIPLGTYIVEVTTPPTLIQIVSLPFEVQVVSLNVALYQNIKKGELLAKVTSLEWIEAQKSAIANIIEYQYHLHTTDRKNRLCKEGIIPKKECIAANARLKTERIKVEASRELLKSFSVDKKVLDNLFKNLKISPYIYIKSPTDGTVVDLNAKLGKSSPPSSALFVIQKEGALWLEGDLSLDKVKFLKKGEDVLLKIENEIYNSKVLQISPIVNQQNQTRHVRFTLDKNYKLLSGFRVNATLIIKQDAFIVPKKAVIKYEQNHIVFIKEKNRFKSVEIEILGEDTKNYYVKLDNRLNAPIVVTSVAVLKNMLGNDDE